MGRLASWIANQLVYIEKSAANKYIKDQKCNWAFKKIDLIIY